MRRKATSHRCMYVLMHVSRSVHRLASTFLKKKQVYSQEPNDVTNQPDGVCSVRVFKFIILE